MSNRVQMECAKQGSIDATKWSSRVLTVDTNTSTLTISRRGHPENLFYHSLKPSIIQLWPYFYADATHDDFYSVEAKRTLCILGTVAPVPDFVVEEVALVGIPLPLSTTDVPLETAMQVQAVDYAAHRGGAVEKRRENTAGTRDAWVLRFDSKVSYDVVLKMLGGMPGLRFVGKSARKDTGDDSDTHIFHFIPLSSLSSTMSSAKPTKKPPSRSR